MVIDYCNHPYILKYLNVGSRITCDPAPTNTDIDILILCKKPIFPWSKNKYIEDLLEAGFVIETENYGRWMHFQKGEPVFAPRTNFISMRKYAENALTSKDAVNFIVTTDEYFYNRFKAATYLAKKLNLLVKRDRISLFQGILYDNFDNVGYNWWRGK